MKRRPTRVTAQKLATGKKTGRELKFAPFFKFRSGTEPTNKRNALIISTMSTTDEWNEDLRCPKCGRTGIASLSQGDDANIPTVYSVPDGFKVVATHYGPDFHCASCKVAVVP
jgi:hypothetical protein